jgi:hypothetical protein
LEAGDIRLGAAKPSQEIGETLVYIVNVERGDFHCREVRDDGAIYNPD